VEQVTSPIRVQVKRMFKASKKRQAYAPTLTVEALVALTTLALMAMENKTLIKEKLWNSYI